jgi:hypothetical protein
MQQNEDAGVVRGSVYQNTRLFAAGFLIGLLIFSSVVSAARHGLEISSCPASVLETGTKNQTQHAGAVYNVHRISLSMFSFSITVQGRIPFAFEYKCESNESSRPLNEGIFVVKSSKRSERNEKMKYPAEQKNQLSDYELAPSKTTLLAGESQEKKIETNLAEPNLSSKWQWAYGAGVENLVSDVGSYSVKFFKDMYSEAKEQYKKKLLQDTKWHYKYGSGQLDRSSILVNKQENCTERIYRPHRKRG